GIAGVVFALVKILPPILDRVWIVPIKDRSPAKSMTLVGTPVATPGDMVPREDELKAFIFGCTEEPGGRSVLLIAVLVNQYLIVDGIPILKTVHGVEDFPDEFLLLASKAGGDAVLGMDVPPIADVLALGVIHRQAELFLLRIRETLVKLRRQGIALAFSSGQEVGCRCDCG